AQVHHGISVALARGRMTQGGHEPPDKFIADGLQIRPRQVRQQPTQRTVAGQVMGHNQVLVAGIEFDKSAGTWVIFHCAPPIIEGKDAGDKVIPQARILQPARLLYRHQGHKLHQSTGIGALASGIEQLTIRRVALHIKHTAAGRFMHKNVAAQPRKCGSYVLSLSHESIRYVQLRVHYPSDTLAAVGHLDADRFARYTQAYRNLGAYRLKGQVLPQHFRQISVMLVPPIKSDGVSEQTGAHTDWDLIHGKTCT